MGINSAEFLINAATETATGDEINGGNYGKKIN